MNKVFTRFKEITQVFNPERAPLLFKHSLPNSTNDMILFFPVTKYGISQAKKYLSTATHPTQKCGRYLVFTSLRKS